MIIYNKRTKSFLLQGKNISYVLAVNSRRFLVNLYYGKKILNNDIDYLISQFTKSYEREESDINADCVFDIMPLEYGFFTHGDFKEPSVIIEREDGAVMSRLRYKSHIIFLGVNKLNGMPYARGDGETLSIVLKDDFSDTEIALNYTVWDDLDVVVRNAVITNIGKETIKIKKGLSFCFQLPDDEYNVMDLYGNWARERFIDITKLGYGIKKIESLRGISSHQLNPFMAIMKNDCSEDFGECFGFQLIYSGNYVITAEKNSNNGNVRIQGGINDVNFSWQLKCGDVFETPQSVLSYSDMGLGELSRRISDFLREQIINPTFVNKPRPIVLNSWEALYFDFNNEKLIELIDLAEPLGIDTFVLDDGWFGERNTDLKGLGDWVVNEKKLQGGLTTVINHCKEKGIKFGLWFEPEMVNEDSDLFRKHPDYAFAKYGIEAVRQRNQLVLDFTKKEVVDYVFEKVSNILKNNGISYVKWDMNRYLTEMYSASLPSERQGEISHRYMLGVYDLAERLTNAFPDVLFEGCASGGGRFDAGMLYYFPQIWTSDNTDAYQRTMIQYGTSMCYPLSSMSCHVSVTPNHQTNRDMPFDTRGAIATLGAFGYELNLLKITDEEKEKIKKQIKHYKSIEKIVLEGDLYRIFNPFESNYFCETVVSKDKNRAYLVGFQTLYKVFDYDKVIKLKGLQEDKIYRIKELGIEASGKALMSCGLVIPWIRDFSSWTWTIEAV